MYADRHARSSGIDPRSLGIAVAVNGAVVAALLLAQPAFKVIDHNRPFTTYSVPIPPPPEPLPPPAQPQAGHHPLNAPRPSTEMPTPPTRIFTLDQSPVPTGTGTTIAPTEAPTPALVTTAPEVDPAHRADLQPVYPATELRAEHEGMVTVRVLIGVDGRVRQVERVAATSDAFFRATEERALAKWRFRPATRGGVPVEGSRTMTIRFVIPR